MSSDELRAARSADRWLCTSLVLLPGPGTVTLITHGYSISDFARSLQTRVGRVIVDKTDLAGNYDIDFETELPSMPGLAPLDSQAGAPREEVSLFTALQEQLGLKLQSERGPVDVLVIDHVEKPTPD